MLVCIKPVKRRINQESKLSIKDFEYMKIIHVNCGLRTEYESDLRSNEHYLSSSDNKPALGLVWR